ncbi:MAG: hypothetical protein HZA93_26675 [Verrucomicrobia bacterium]|nr:hypothetical protein [Verrucomicrobiota bacterium]
MNQNASYRGEMAPRFASGSVSAANTPAVALEIRAFDLIHLIHKVWLEAPSRVGFLLSHVLAIKTELERHSVGSRISTLVPPGSSRMKEAAGVSGLTEDKRHEVGKPLRCSV